jgi:hypothetical protein
VHTGFQARARDFEMRFGRHYDGSDVDIAQQLAIIAHGAHAVLCADRARTRLVEVGDAEELDAVERGILLSVIASERTHTDDGGTQFGV